MSNIPFNDMPVIPSSEVRTTSEILMQTTDANGVSYTGRVPLPTAMAGNSRQAIYSVALSISSAEILALNSTPKAFGLNVPAGYAAVPVGDIYMGATYGGATYATNTSLRIRSVGGAQNFVSAVNALAFSADVFIPLTANAVSSGKAVTDGADWEVYVPSGNPTAGTSDVTIYANYMLIEL